MVTIATGVASDAENALKQFLAKVVRLVAMSDLPAASACQVLGENFHCNVERSLLWLHALVRDNWHRVASLAFILFLGVA